MKCREKEIDQRCVCIRGKKTAGISGRIESFESTMYRFYRELTNENLITGYCNLTRDRIFDITDQTNNHLLGKFGYNRNDFFKGIAGFIINTEERKAFMNTFLTMPLKKAHLQGKCEQSMECFMKLPHEVRGRHLTFQVNLVKNPLNQDIIGFLSVKDISSQTCCGRPCCRGEDFCSCRLIAI